MGLDSYLTGECFFLRPQRMTKYGEVREEHIEIGYWRKDWNLHNFITRILNPYTPECESSELTKDGLQYIIDAIKNGEVYDEVSEYTVEVIRTFETAIAFLAESEDWEYRAVKYLGTW